jgi:hypothetical protein
VPCYYSVTRTPGTPGTPITTNGAANTLSTHFRFATVASQPTARIMGIFGVARFGTAGGAALLLIRPGALGTGGTANTPSKKNNNFPAASTTAFDDATAITAGTTPILQQAVGVAQTGGMGGWVALEIDDSYVMASGGGATTSLELGSKANSASVTIDPTLNLQEN